ncbi:MAG: phosphate ABC transporter substrate-binding protein PstS [Deltaproteobacteria bacterium]
MNHLIFRALVFLLLIFPTSSWAEEVELLGAGSTLAYPLYSAMFETYWKETGVRVNYQAIGSGGGIRQLINRTVDFGATDAFMTIEELAAAPAKILHIPTCIGAVVVTYNLAGNPQLKFTPDVIADMFLGKLTWWDERRIVTLNPAVKLPHLKMIIVRRSDGSGTTFAFTDYLSKVSETWMREVGRGKAVNWPVGLGAKGNPGVAGLISQLPGAIGYVELVYALQNGMPVASIENRSGKFVLPTIMSTTLAEEVPLPEDMRVSITDTRAPDGYSISSFTWLLVYKEQAYQGRSVERAKHLAKLLWWVTHQGQKYTEPLHYAPLPVEAVKRADRIIESMTYDGKPLLK